MTVTRRTRHIDNKGDDFDFAFKAPANGKLPLRRVGLGCLLCMTNRSKGCDSESDGNINKGSLAA